MQALKIYVKFSCWLITTCINVFDSDISLSPMTLKMSTIEMLVIWDTIMLIMMSLWYTVWHISDPYATNELTLDKVYLTLFLTLIHVT